MEPFMTDTRFVILGYGRSGSTAFRNLLSQHENIQAYGEVFRGRRGSGGQGGALVNGQSYKLGEDSVAYLENTVFAAPNEFGKSCIGFKLFFYHLRADPVSYALWPYLIGRKDIKVIFLFRRNLFDCYVSQQRAQRSGQFGLHKIRTTTDAHQTPFEIDLADCRDFMRTRAQVKARLQEFFEAHDCLTIDYEALFAAPQEMMATAFRFLGEEPIEVGVKDRKLNRVPHREGITNFAQVVRSFRRTLFEDYFDPEDLAADDARASS